ncbi:MAG: choice-of-anchor D domain-containing protein [Betaproteobacteria bacterium]|nr:choice-of-anchor D domain-containing protein [Betaproteobacteria bacterium]
MRALNLLFAACRSPLRAACRATLVFLLCSGGAHAGDPVAGMALYNDVPDSVISCGNALCHGPNPNDNVNGLQKAGNNPGVIQTAIKMGVTQMMFLNGLLNPFQLDDISAYLAPQPDLSAGAVDFPAQTAGTVSAPQTVTLRSIGGVNLSVAALAVTGPHAADFSVAGSCTAGSELQSVTILQAGGSCDVVVSFQPAAGGARNATITLTYAGATTFPSAQAIALSGQGTAPLVPAAAIDPVYIDFGEIVRNATSAPRTIVLANPGTAPLLVGSLSVTGQHAGEFGLSGTCMGAALPLQIGAGGSCTVVVDFTPQGLDLRNAELRIQHNAAGSPGLVALTGVGVAPTCAPPPPPAEFQTLACPAGQAGSIMQSRAWVCTGSDWLAGPWVTVANDCHASLPPASLGLVEFFNTGLVHYFMTANPAESHDIETGAAGPGWGQTLVLGQVWGTAPAPDLVPVCRFYGNPAPGPDGKRLGPNSHFYTADAAECAAVKTDPGWLFEGVVFQVVAPTLGSCPQPLVPVYRSYNGRFLENDSNHRYATDPATVAQMSALGWTSEGVVLCIAAE